MAPVPPPPSRLKLLWIASFCVPALAQLFLSIVGSDFGVNEASTVLFGIVLIGASLCAIAAGMVISRARRTKEVELGYLGLFFLATSVLPLVHGITTPGVLYSANSAFAAAAFWSIPLGLVVGLPAMLGRSRYSTAVDETWERWMASGQIAIVAIGASLLVFTSMLPDPTAGGTWVPAIAIASFAGCVLLSKRHLDVAIIARSASPLIISIGYGFVGASAFVWLGATPYSTGFWIAHLLDISGVFFGTIGALVAYGRSSHVRPLIAPILTVDPRSAFELGLEPSIHRLVADLEEKDPITRDHVIRTTELSMSVGAKMGLGPDLLRELGLTALLHDIGKLLIPDALLNKPGPLDDHEYEIVKRHAAYGAAILEKSPPLVSIAPAVRAHHEQIDGSGYPTGLIGNQIPLSARIVSACDAFDALSNTRQYRQGVSLDKAIEVLEQHAGSQWDRRVVETLVRTVRNNPPRSMPERLDTIGRIGCDCIPHVVAA